MTGENIVESAVLNSEVLPEFIGGKNPRLDLNCRTGDGTRVDVEIQMTKEDDDQLMRAVYYGSKLFAGSSKSGEFYKDIPKVYQIMLADFRIFDDNEYVHHLLFKDQFNNIACKNLQVTILEFQKIIALVAKMLGQKKLRKKTLNDSENLLETLKNLQDDAFWAILIRKSDDKNFMKTLVKSELADARAKLIKMAGANMMEVSQEEKEWAYHLSYDRAEIDYNNGLKLAEMKGAHDKAVESARNLYANGVSIEIIAKSLNMTQEQVSEIVENKN